MKKYFSLIIVTVSCFFIGNSVFASTSWCDIYKNLGGSTYTECIYRERYDEAINKYNAALNRQDYAQAISALEIAKKHAKYSWNGNVTDLNNRIQNHAAYLCSAYAGKEDYKTALIYCKKSLAIYEEATVLYNAGFVSSRLENWSDALSYLNKAKKKSLDSNLNFQIDGLLEYVNWGKEYADLKKTWKTNDKYGYYQYYMQGINIFNAWDKLPNKKNEVVIAVIDDGINLNHPDFKNRIWVNKGETPGDGMDNDRNGYVDDYNGWNFVNKTNNTKPSGTHGTMVAGVIASETDNIIGIAGIVPSVKIMSLNVFSNSVAQSNDVVSAINYAIDNGANIINLSLGGEQFTYSNYYDSVLKRAYDKGIIIVVAAGNGDALSQDAGVNTTVNKISPLCNESNNNNKIVIGVGALTKNGNQARWSNYGSCVDFYMYGENIYSTAVNQTGEPYMWANGTSLSAPIIAGIVGLGYNKYGKIKPDVVYDNLKKSKVGNVVDASKYLDNLSLSQGELGRAIKWMINKKFTNAKNANEFKRNNEITRAEAAKFFVTFANLFKKNTIVKGVNECIFSDIGNAPASLRLDITTACRYGLLAGSKGKFMPNSKFTNAQAVTVFMRMYSGKKDESGNHYADRYFIEAYKLGLIDGILMGNQKNYEIGATRGDVATLLYRGARLIKSKQANKK